MAKRSMMTMRCLAAIALVTVVRCSESAEAEKHYIPDGYFGYVIIAHVGQGGEPARYEGDARVYDIPETGFLLSNTRPNPGLGRLEYYYREQGGGLKRISIALGNTAPGDGVIRVYGLVTGGYGNPGERCSIPYDRYFVGSYDDYIKVRDERQTDPRLVLLWNKCRESAGL